jgi:hypothetical protein
MTLHLTRLSLVALLWAAPVAAQAPDPTAPIRQAMLDYIDGFYSGDTTLLVRSVSPSVIKYGYWQDSTNAPFVGEPMSYAQIVAKPRRPHPPKAGAPRDVQVLEAQAQVASGKVRAWWGIDYILLARENDRWMIRAVLWQGPLPTTR